MADREGRLEDRPLRIKAELFPYENCNVEKWLDQLSDLKFITRYEKLGVRCIQISNFHRHQTPHIKEPQSTVPAPDFNGTETIPVCQSIERGNQESGKGNQLSEGAAKKFQPPTVSEVAEYCRERQNTIDAEAFVAHYVSKGWKVGKNAMKDWKAAVVTWEKNQGSFANNKPSRIGPGQTHDPDAAKKDPNYGRM